MQLGSSFLHRKSGSHVESLFSAKTSPFRLSLDFLNREWYGLQHIEKWQEFMQPLAGIQKSSSFKSEKLMFFKKTFEFPPTVAWIPVIFQYVVAHIILCWKSAGWAETVKFWPRTSSQRVNRIFKSRTFDAKTKSLIKVSLRHIISHWVSFKHLYQNLCVTVTLYVV